jgi:hypothetical protein
MRNQFGLTGTAVQPGLVSSAGSGVAAISALRLFAVVLAAYMVCAGLTGYPLPFGDAPYFMPASIQLANGHGFTNPVFDQARKYDALGIARFIYHGFTFELLLAALIRPLMAICGAASIASVAALGLIHAAGILALSETCVPFLRRSRRVTLSCCIAALGLTVYSAIMFLFCGRPEELAALPVCVIVLAIYSLGVSTVTVVLSGVCIGVIASISPLPAALAGLLFSTYLASVEGLRPWLIHTLSAGVIALAVFFGLAVTIYPYPVIDLIRGIQIHAATVETVVGFRILHVFIANADLPVFGFVLCLVVTAGIVQAFRGRRLWSERALLAVLVVLFVAALIRFVFNAYLTYNIVPLWPACLAFIIWSTGLNPGRKARDLMWPIALVVALALPSIGFLRIVLLYPFFLHSGTPQAEAQALFARQLATIPEPLLYVSRSVFLLTDDYNRIVDYGDKVPQGKVLVMTQYRSGRTVPEVLPGYQMIYENFNPSPVKLFGISVANTIPGYQFVIYRPITEAGGLAKP